MSFSPTVSPLILLGVKGNPFMKITVINREWKLLFLLYLHFMSFARYQEALVINVCFDIGAFLLREVA